LSVAHATIQLNKRKVKMNKQKMKDSVILDCADCGGRGYIYWGLKPEFDVKTCDCVGA